MMKPHKNTAKKHLSYSLVSFVNSNFQNQVSISVKNHLNLRGWKVDHLIDLVTPQHITEGEALELDNERFRKLPDGELLTGLTVLLTPRTIPVTI